MLKIKLESYYNKISNMILPMFAFLSPQNIKNLGKYTHILNIFKELTYHLQCDFVTIILRAV